MRKTITLLGGAVLGMLLPWHSIGQCSVSGVSVPNGSNSNASSCVCEQPGQTNCDLLPDMTISWYAAQYYLSGPNEYPQSGAGANNGRLRVTGSTPNIGHGPLNVRGVDKDGYRWFLCGTDTFNIYDPGSNQSFTCPNSQSAQQLIVQRVYKKNGSSMHFEEFFAGTMTYHPSHGHNHVDDWSTFTLRLEDPNDPDPLNWPVVGNGAKVGFCLMDYYSCSQGSANGHCRTSQEYQGGSVLNQNGQFDNYQLGGGGYGCSQISQGISVGYTDVYSESLDGMWVNIPPGTCNGDYWLVLEVDPNDNFAEEDDSNNWTAIPITLSQQEPANSGAACSIEADKAPVICSGEAITLTCVNAGWTYQWSNGATTRSIAVTQSGTYSVTVTNPCGVSSSAPFQVTVLDPQQPSGQGDTIVGPGSAMLSATGADLHWFDAPAGGVEVASGPVFGTPVISQTTSYWVEEHAVLPGVNAFGGKSDNGGGGAIGSFEQYLTFDAQQDLTIVSVKVYASGAGDRTFQVLGPDGSFVDQATVFCVDGESRVTVDLDVPAGQEYRLYVTSTLRNLYRNNGGVSYPYEVPGVISITGSSAGASYYYYCYDLEVTTADMICTSPRTEVVATVEDGLPLGIRVLLEGPFDAGTQTMSDQLREDGHLPLTEPFSDLGFAQVGEGGEEAISFYVLNTMGNDAIVDWVLVELRDKSDPSIVLNTRSALLQRDGDIVDLNGVAPLVMHMPADDYHVAVRHRNHLGCMTAAPVALASTLTPLDLTASGTPTWGLDARKAVSGVMVLWSGNVHPDDALKYTGADNDRDPILVAIGGVVPTATMPGYHVMDTNLDGTVKYTGTGNDRDIILNNIGGTAPTNTRAEQLP